MAQNQLYDVVSECINVQENFLRLQELISLPFLKKIAHTQKWLTYTISL